MSTQQQRITIFNIKTISDIDTFIDHFKTDKISQVYLNETRLKQIITLLGLNISVVIEESYNDKVYNDTYYHHYSSKFNTPLKKSKRLSFFKTSDISKDQFYSKEGHKKLQDTFIGILVLRPLSKVSIGRTLFNPKQIDTLKSCHIRTTNFEVVIIGVSLNIEAFPFSSQDGEVMTCAETTIWGLLEYYGTRYPEYKTVLPSEITNSVSKRAFERVVPSIGLSYYQNSQTLKDFGFAPKIYSRFNGGTNIFEDNDFKRFFHYYIESGIPFTTSISLEKANKKEGHAIVCVGHSSKRDLSVPAAHNNGIYINDSSEFYDKYIFMDDNNSPYTTYKFDDFDYYKQVSSKKYDKTTIKSFIVPLYKRIHLDSSNASKIIYKILLNDKIGISKSIDDFPEYSVDNPIVVRIFLTSSRRYKIYASLNHKEQLKPLYTQRDYPKFIWVGEITTKKLYQEEKILGEIILDATSYSTETNYLDSIISIHFLNQITNKTKYGSIEELIRGFKDIKNKNAYSMYKHNLK